MSQYVYIKSDPGLWTVGFYDPNGKWQPESDHTSTQEAAERAAWLNGSRPTMNRLRQVRDEQGVSQLHLAYLTGIQPSAISRVENGHMAAYPNWRKRFALALKVSECDIFGRTQDGSEK